jgi:hypothetical protein
VLHHMKNTLSQCRNTSELSFHKNIRCNSCILYKLMDNKLELEPVLRILVVEPIRELGLFVELVLVRELERGLVLVRELEQESGHFHNN